MRRPGRSSAQRLIFGPPVGVLLEEDAAAAEDFYPSLVVARVLRRLRSVDARVAAVFAAAAALEAIVRSRSSAYLVINLTGAPLLLLLAVRRSRPLMTVTGFCAGAIVGSLLQAWLIPHAASDVFVPIFGLLLAIYSVGAHGSWREVALAAPQPLLVVVTVDSTLPHSESLASAVVFFAIFIVAVPIIGGRLVRGRSVLIGRLEEQGRELAEQRTAYVAAALARERLRVTNGFHRDLAEGMQRLVEALPAEGAGGGAGCAAEVETRARRLLAETREAVVALADGAAVSEPPAPAVAAESQRTSSEAAQPWTVLAAAALTAGLLVETRGLPLRVSAPAAAVACVVLALPLAFAWVRPLAAITVLWVGAALFAHEVGPLQQTTTAIGLSFVPPFIVAALASRPRALIGLAVCWCGALATFGAGALPGDAAIATACWLAGAGFRQRSRLVNQLHANNVLIKQGRAALTAQAVDEERMRLASELHDAVGHSLTVVALQAGAARRIWETDRAKAETMLDTVRSVAVAGLAELRNGLTTMPEQDSASSLDELVDRARAAGLVVDATIEDILAILPPQQLSTVYRIVQESLTNVLKHSPGATVAVDIRRVGSKVEMTIASTPPTSASLPPQRSGHGLSGMRRRVEECGGDLMHGLSDDGRFVVTAQLPLAVVPA